MTEDSIGEGLPPASTRKGKNLAAASDECDDRCASGSIRRSAARRCIGKVLVKPSKIVVIDVEHSHGL